MIKLKKIQDIDVKGKKVFLRADLDVPLESRAISDETRLNAWFPTLELLLKNQAHVFIAGHLGRPEEISEQFSLKPVAEWVKSQLELHNDLEIVDINGFKAFKITGNLILLENLRFYKEEEENPSTSSGQVFAQRLASLADIYVNDAFATSHRAHASIVGITKFLPSYAGLRLQKEAEELSKVLENPKRPLTVVIGGAKIETKLPLVKKMHAFADYVLVGGEIAENDKVLLKVQHENLKGRKSILLVADLTENSKDITTKSAENFIQILRNANTIVWNGPMGVIQNSEFRIQSPELDTEKGTRILAQELAKLSNYRIVGGGDTIAYLKKNNLLHNFSFVSTGGGAMLEFLAGEALPGLNMLSD